MTEPVPFGIELRRRRLAAGLSLAAMARQVHYSKSHLSKIENGVKPPGADLARQCDAVLATGGNLAALLPAPRRPAGDPHPIASDGPAWLVAMDDAGSSLFQPVPRRALLTGAAGAVIAWPLATGGPGEQALPAPLARTALAGYRRMFGEMRRMLQWTGPDALLPALVGGLHALRAQLTDLTGADRAAAAALAARYAELIGWLSQERGDDGAAEWWTAQAVTFADAAGEHGMAAYALVRRALMAMYRRDAATTIDLAVTARHATADLRIRGLAAQREAQGHALAGQHGAAMRALDRAAVLLDRAGPPPGPVLGPSSVSDVVAMARGWCLHDLGRPREATGILQAELDRIDPAALRARARCAARLALAWTAAGEPLRAATVIDPVLETFGRLRSATVRTDLKDLVRGLSRWPRSAEVAAIRVRVAEAMFAG